MARPKNLGLGDWNQMIQSFYGESDRGAAILAGSFTENSLGLFLRHRIRDKKIADDLFAPVGPLSSFSQRIAIAFAFGLITEKQYKEFELVRKIRNYFAHHPLDSTFNTREVRELASNLGMINHGAEAHAQNPAPGYKYRIGYLLSCGLLCGKLLDTIASENQAKV